MSGSEIADYIGHKIPVANYDTSQLPELTKPKPRPRKKPQQRRGGGGKKRPPRRRRPAENKS